MNTPIEKIILDLIALREHYKFTERHGRYVGQSDAIEAALKLCHKRLQEEADVIAEAYNSAGGESGGSKYYQSLYRQGADELKSLVGYNYESQSSKSND